MSILLQHLVSIDDSSFQLGVQLIGEHLGQGVDLACSTIFGRLRKCTTSQQEKDLSVLPFSCKTIRPQGTHPYQLKLVTQGRWISNILLSHRIILCSSCKRKHPNADHYTLSLGTDWFMGLKVLFPVSMHNAWDLDTKAHPWDIKCWTTADHDGSDDGDNNM